MLDGLVTLLYNLVYTWFPLCYVQAFGNGGGGEQA